ncbi:hypothetical protein ANCDUO_21965, partial [Ancylostoma duodenale]
NSSGLTSHLFHFYRYSTMQPTAGHSASTTNIATTASFRRLDQAAQASFPLLLILIFLPFRLVRKRTSPLLHLWRNPRTQLTILACRLTLAPQRILVRTFHRNNPRRLTAPHLPQLTRIRPQPSPILSIRKYTMPPHRRILQLLIP